MAKTFVIMESPAKARKVQTYLGSQYIVEASVGHIRELPMPKALTKDQKEKYGEFSIDVKSGSFEPLFKVSPDKTKVVKNLKDKLAKCDEMIIFTDDDNEGAAIGMHLLEVLKPTVPVYRAVSHEITETAVKEALKNKKTVDEKKRLPREFWAAAESATTRALWDRLYGFATSPYVWRSLKPGASSGRTQSPGIRLVVEREEKRLAFTSVNFYSISSTFDDVPATLMEYKGQKIATGKDIGPDGELINSNLLITDENIDEIIKDLKKKDYSVGDVKSKPYRRSAPPPFTTMTALQSIGGKTGMSTKQITSLLQNLYANEGVITYIRTVSVSCSPEAVDAARKELAKMYGNSMVSAQPKIFKDKKEGNSGHECIRPVVDHGGSLVRPKLSDVRALKSFNAIFKRLLASQAIDCEGITWMMSVVSGDKEARFAASETEIHEPGWTKVYSDDDSDANNNNSSSEDNS